MAARAFAAGRGVSISWLTCAETRVLALSSPDIEFEISVFVGICGVFGKKCRKRRPALSKNLLGGGFRIVFFGVFLSVSPFASVFAVFWPSLDFLHMPASTCIRLSSLCGGLGGGWGGGDDVHATATGVLIFFC